MTCTTQISDYRNPNFEYDWELATQEIDDKFFGRVTSNAIRPPERKETRNDGKNRLRSDQEFFGQVWKRRLEVGIDIPNRITCHNTGRRTVNGDITFNLRIHYRKSINWPGGHKWEAIPNERVKFWSVIDRINQAANNLK